MLNITEEQKKYLLSEKRHNRIFEKIKNIYLQENQPASNPKIIFLGGQPGSGKTSLMEAAIDEFPKNEGVLVVNSDTLREEHPFHKEIREKNELHASFLVNPDASVWTKNLLLSAIEHKRNIILDGTLGGDTQAILETMKLLKEQSYQIELRIIALNEKISKLGIYQRYETQKVNKGWGRWVSMKAHDANYTNLPKNLATIESSGLVDKIELYTRQYLIKREVSLLYQNMANAGKWERQLSIVEVLEIERNRPWTEEEKISFKNRAAQVIKFMENRDASIEVINQFRKDVGEEVE